MNSTLLEELLNEEEGSTLDFKRDHYLFQNATDDEKSELLKDILAFSNAWRRTDAYILIGVEEVKGGRSNIIGITTHFDDATLQQFVNSKTNRPINFSYSEITTENVQVGIIHIPLQERPIYLKKNYGKLKEHVVYIRRGSSTDKASPDEISTMGKLKLQEIVGEIVEQPKLNPVIERLRKEQEQNNTVLLQINRDAYNKFRIQCKIIEVNDLFAVFKQEQGGQEEAGPISQMTVSYVPSMKMTLFSIPSMS